MQVGPDQQRNDPQTFWLSGLVLYPFRCFVDSVLTTLSTIDMELNMTISLNSRPLMTLRYIVQGGF